MKHLIAPSIFLLVLIGCVAGVPYFFEWLLGPDRRIQAEFNNLPNGMSLDDASAALNLSPIRESDECCLPQRKGFEQEFKRAEDSKATRFYLYSDNTNWYYCLGFNDDGKLVYTGQGSS